MPNFSSKFSYASRLQKPPPVCKSAPRTPPIIVSCPLTFGPTQTWNLTWHTHPAYGWPDPLNITVFTVPTTGDEYAGTVQIATTEHGLPVLLDCDVTFGWSQPDCLSNTLIVLTNFDNGQTANTDRQQIYTGGYPFFYDELLRLGAGGTQGNVLALGGP